LNHVATMIACGWQILPFSAMIVLAIAIPDAKFPTRTNTWFGMTPSLPARRTHPSSKGRRSIGAISDAPSIQAMVVAPHPHQMERIPWRDRSFHRIDARRRNESASNWSSMADVLSNMIGCIGTTYFYSATKMRPNQRLRDFRSESFLLIMVKTNVNWNYICHLLQEDGSNEEKIEAPEL
jgi:hypothetical protein